MKVEYVLIFGLTVLIIGYMWGCKITCSKTEGYGQDASVRASSGWIAGNGLYGYDPITEFAEQIEQMRASHHATHPDGTIKEGFCPFDASGNCMFAKTGRCPYMTTAAYPSYPPSDDPNRLLMASPYMSGPPCGCH